MRAWARREVPRYAELLGICALAITQPLLAAFGDAPEQFAFRGATSADIVVFSVLIALVPAAALWLPGALGRLRSPRVGDVLHRTAVGVALFALLLQLLYRTIGVGGLVKAALAAAGAAGGVWLFDRFEGLRLWTRVLSLFSLVLVGLFLFSSPAGELVFAEPPDAVELVLDEPPTTADGDAEPAPELPDIVMIVLDELPTALLLDESGAIDPIRYPAHAEFAADATWYRRYTSVSANTVTAVPALLSGQLPPATAGPLWTQQPDTLFRLLAGSYHLAVSETVTRLCPRVWCAGSPVPPPADAGGASETAADASPVSQPETRADTRGGLTGLLGDAADLWADQMALDRDDRPTFSGFEEEAFAPESADGPPATTGALETVDVPEASEDEAQQIEEDAEFSRYFGVFDRAGQAPRVDGLRAAIAPSPGPTLYFLHLVLPHQPFLFTETGATYEGPEYTAATSADWDEAILSERMSLQMQFTDRLVGDILDDLRETGIYDDALIIVTADHGASLDRSKEYRTYDGTNASELMVAPLLVKAPGQAAGTVSDAPVESIDVLPTVADLLGVEVPWTTDGESVLTSDPAYVDPGCDDVRHYVPVGDEEGDGWVELCAADVVPAGLEPLLAPVLRTDEWAVGNLARHSLHADLLGASWNDLGAVTSGATFTLDTGGVRDGASPPVGVVEGTIDDTDAEWVAVSIDGRIAGISPLYDRTPDDGTNRADHFAILVPTPLLDESGYEIRVATLETVGGELIATELTAAG